MKERRPAVDAVVAGVGGVILGFLIHLVAVFLRDNGPTMGGLSLRGNGAAIVLPVAIAIALLAIWFLARRRSWVAVVFAPIALFVGLFNLGGGF